MQKLPPTQNSNTAVAEVNATKADYNAPLRVIRKPYVTKRLPKPGKGQRLYVSFSTFKKELHIFDPEMREKYTNQQVIAILSLTMKKVADRIIKNLWRMPFPNGIGKLYMKEAQRAMCNTDAMSEGKMARLIREVRYGMKRVFLKWNKERVRFSYKDIWMMKKSRGYFRSLLYDEVLKRCEDPTKPNYRGHII